MAQTIANITFNVPPGSYGVLVEYKAATDTIWTKPTSPTNPSMAGTYPILINAGTLYYVRLSSFSPNCTSKYVYLNVIAPSTQCCPTGYTLSPDGTYCYQQNTIAATPPSGSQNTVAATYASYSTCGSYIYNPGYNINGTGTSTQITTSNSFWVNGSGGCVDNTTVDGPLNRTGLWAATTLNNQDVGFSVCLNINTTKTYYVGVGCDNYAIIKLDGNVIVQQDPTALGVQYGVGTLATFKVWHIYPVTISSGPHILELVGHNIDLAAALGCEVYDAVPSDLINAVSYAALGSKLIFSSKNYIGQPIQIGTNGFGYTCPAGYALSYCSSPVVCKQLITTPLINC